MVGGMPGMTFVNRISSLLGQCENAWWGSHTRKSTVTHRIVPACMELMERYIRVGAHFWPDYTGGGTYHEQERRRIREELQGAVFPARQKEIPPLPEPPLVLVELGAVLSLAPVL
ncbi:hypothetical protein XENTR_v10020593 [Xenopus tropicalis]|nr:hypothetical protein XENTR_v10020593 [Xenopus tropicalis]